MKITESRESKIDVKSYDQTKYRIDQMYHDPVLKIRPERTDEIFGIGIAALGVFIVDNIVESTKGRTYGYDRKRKEQKKA